MSKSCVPAVTRWTIILFLSSRLFREWKSERHWVIEKPHETSNKNTGTHESGECGQRHYVDEDVEGEVMTEDDGGDQRHNWDGIYPTQKNMISKVF
jgi:hypothetical protein